ncbi:hypothetical protein [Micromonospora sp. NPDC048839]|uniref:hypothetical protein n=1 Tax=Micromonospora sp. NPDC048839 TaxID=3155641 RepID=UPI0033CC06D6
MFRFEAFTFETRTWRVLRQHIEEWERQGLLDANLEDGSIYSDTDPEPEVEALLGPGNAVFRLVDEAGEDPFPVIDEDLPPTD